MPTCGTPCRCSCSTADLEAQAFPTAEELLAAVDLEKPSCILLDVRLPGLSGLDLLDHLSQQRSKAAVIVITGHGDVPMAVRAMKAGAYHFVQKPFDPEELLEVVEEALRYVDELKDAEAKIVRLPTHTGRSRRASGR